MRKLAFVYYLLAFVALENEGLSDCPNCFDINQNHGNHYQSFPIARDQRRYESSTNYQYIHPHHHQYQVPPVANPIRTPQYRPIIVAYHPRVNNRQQQFFTKNSDHLLDDNPQPSNQDEHESSLEEQPEQPHNQQQSFVRVPQKSVRQRIANHYWPPLINHTFGNQHGFITSTTTTTMMTTATTTTTTTPTPQAPDPEEFYREVYTSSTTKPNYRPRPVSVRIPTLRPSLNDQHHFSNHVPQHSSLEHNQNKPKTTNMGENPIVINNIDNSAIPKNNNLDNSNLENSGRFSGTNKPRRGGSGRLRKRLRSTTTTTTTEPPYYDDEDYYDYDQDDYDDDYDYLATTTTTTTTRRPRGRSRGRGGGRRRGGQPSRRFQQQSPPKPAEPSTTTTTTTLSPNYKPRPDGRIIDYHADPNFPYELKGADLTDYPFYVSIPENNFNCKGRHDGYYANIELKCQVYHHCAVGHQRYDFLCPNYTLFDQTTFTCRFVNTVDCEASENHYNRNNELYVESTTNRPENANTNQQYHHPQQLQHHDHLQTSGSDSSSSTQLNVDNNSDNNNNQLPIIKLNRKQQIK